MNDVTWKNETCGICGNVADCNWMLLMRAPFVAMAKSACEQCHLKRACKCGNLKFEEEEVCYDCSQKSEPIKGYSATFFRV